MILFSSIYYFFVNSLNVNNGLSINTIFIIDLVVTCILSLTDIIICRIARFRMDYDVYLRKHGTNISDQSKSSENKDQSASISKTKIETKEHHSSPLASSNLVKDESEPKI